MSQKAEKAAQEALNRKLMFVRGLKTRATFTVPSLMTKIYPTEDELKKKKRKKETTKTKEGKETAKAKENKETTKSKENKGTAKAKENKGTAKSKENKETAST